LCSTQALSIYFILATSLLIDIDPNASWTQNKVTVAGSNNSEDHLDRFYGSFGFCIDEDQTIYIAGLYARRIVEWKSGATSGLVVIGAHDYEDKNDDLGGPTCVIIDKQTDSLIICDWINQRVVQWPRRDGIEGITLISNIHCWGAAIGNDGCLYVSDMRKNEVRRWQIGDTDAEVVAGGNGAGDSLNQLNDPRHLFVDHNNSIYVADSGNHRVMKWIKGAKEGIVVAGGNGPGNALTQLCGPDAVIVDKQENVYVADGSNHRIVRWHKDAIEGNIVVHMNTKDEQEPYSFNPVCLAFDLYYNLYALDYSNDEILRFSLVNHHS
jgi:sugar lactone lactonase YvrE